MPSSAKASVQTNASQGMGQPPMRASIFETDADAGGAYGLTGVVLHASALRLDLDGIHDGLKLSLALRRCTREVLGLNHHPNALDIEDPEAPAVARPLSVGPGVPRDSRRRCTR